MRKFLVLIAGAAVAYGLVGAAASSLQVSQAVVPAQGNVGDGLVGQCAEAVTISYEYFDVADADVSITSGNATQVNAIVVTPVLLPAGATPSCTWDDGTNSGDQVALAFGNASPGFTVTNPVGWSESTAFDGMSLEGVTPTYGGWIFNLDGGAIPISAFDPGVITVTLWRVPPTEYVPPMVE